MRRSPLSDPRRAAHRDPVAAHAAGLQCGGVASHNFDAEALRDGGADWVIDSLEDRLPFA